ncbi:MFS family permease [Bacillus mesophilus]|uniref:MFS transporter n=1 Tax=Bacillus mesophilus TaxID=1808955 RepID=A0A6M0Q2S4_9BACI|nr:MFS transporter [Bacillus mesophilus]MBM7659822.1 MFS family permease [Bacillus mesophilus]NEY70681.1 MFS transporter [Bacillus mesophilus]
MTSSYRSIAILLIVTGTFVASNIYTLIPIYDLLTDELTTTTSMIALGSTSFTLCYAIGLLLFGTMSDVVGRKPILVLGMLLFSITSLCVSFADSDFSMIVTRGLQGFAGGSFAPVAFAYTFDLYNGKFRALILSMINTGFLVAGILGQIISASIATNHGWEYVFYFYFVIYLLLFLLSAKFLPQNKSKTNTSFKPLQSIKLFSSFLQSKNLLLCYIITFSLLLTPISFYDALNQYLLPISSAEDLFFIRTVALLGTILSIFGGAINAKYGLKGSFYIGIALLIGSLIPMILIPDFYVILYSAIFLVSSISILIPTIIAIIGTIEQKSRGSAIALYSFTLLIGASFGSLLTSILPFQGVLLFLLLYGIINIFLMRKISYSR